jgi:hypothetical protein
MMEGRLRVRSAQRETRCEIHWHLIETEHFVGGALRAEIEQLGAPRPVTLPHQPLAFNPDALTPGRQPSKAVSRDLLKARRALEWQLWYSVRT